MAHLLMIKAYENILTLLCQIVEWTQLYEWTERCYSQDYIVAADYGYSSSGGFYNLELFNYTQLLQSNKENLEQRKEQSYKQIIDWLITGLDYITIKYECGGAENDIVEVFDLGATEQIIAGIKRLVARKGWGVYTNNEGELVIRDWKMNNGVQTVIQEGGNVLTSAGEYEH